jgi:hypothetical protein
LEIVRDGFCKGLDFLGGVVEGDWGCAEDARPPPIYAIACFQEGLVEGFSVAVGQLEGELGAMGIFGGE